MVTFHNQLTPNPSPGCQFDFARRVTFRCPYRRTCGKIQSFQVSGNEALKYGVHLMIAKDKGWFDENQNYRYPHCRRRVDLSRIYYYRYFFEDIRGWICWKCDFPNDFALEETNPDNRPREMQKIVLRGEDDYWGCCYPKDGACVPCWLPEKQFWYRQVDAWTYFHPRPGIGLDEYWPEDGEPVEQFLEAEDNWLDENLRESEDGYSIFEHDFWPGAIGEGVDSYAVWAQWSIQRYNIEIYHDQWHGTTCDTGKHPIHTTIKLERIVDEIKRCTKAIGPSRGPLDPIYEGLFEEQIELPFVAQRSEKCVRLCIATELTKVIPSMAILSTF